MEKSAAANENWTALDLPRWISGGKPADWLEQSGLQFKREGQHFRVRTIESYKGSRPRLASAMTVYHSGRIDDLEKLAQRRELVDLSQLRGVAQEALDEIDSRAAAGNGSLHRLLYRNQLAMSAPLASGVDLPEAARAALSALESVSWQDEHREGRPFSQVGLVHVTPELPLIYRVKLPGVLLRVTQDERLRQGDTRHIAQLLRAERGRVFQTGEAYLRGFYWLESYLGPLLGCATPAIWALQVIRPNGTLVMCLGRAIGGTSSHPSTPLEMIRLTSESAGKSYEIPDVTLAQQLAALHWWVSALNSLFGVLTDLSNFADATGNYDAPRHLATLATVDQLFRRIATALSMHGVAETELTLLFTCIDTLQALNRKEPELMFSLRHARKTLTRVEHALHGQGPDLLLHSVRRAVCALAQVQDGFFLARETGSSEVIVGGSAVTLETAAARLLYALRNATHGHLGRRSTEQAQTALLASHTGDVSPDIAALPLLYLLEILINPEQLRQILRAPRRGAGS